MNDTMIMNEADVMLLCAKAATALALSHRISVCPSVCLKVRHMGGSVKTEQARITKCSPLAARKTLVSGSVKLFHKFEMSHPQRGC